MIRGRNPKSKPHVVVFFGGDFTARDLSVATGYQVCHYIPRNTFSVIPVHIARDGKWQVPLGILPSQGPVNQMMKSMFQALKPVPPKQGLQRLLQKPIAAMMSVLRGKGGDDGATPSLGHTLGIPVIGSPAYACHQTYNKHLCIQRVADIVAGPRTLFYSANNPTEEIIEDIRKQIVPSLFVKPTIKEVSTGVELIHSTDELVPAINRAKRLGDVLIQERLGGSELNVTIVEDEYGNTTVLPITLIVPKIAHYYDARAKRQAGRVLLNTQDHSSNKIINEVSNIARDVYDRLDCRGFASLDFIASDQGIHLLEVNTIPTLSTATPLAQQLTAGNLHPSLLVDRLIRQSLQDGF